MSPHQPVELVVITGMSGAGKSEAMAAFEDNGYFCVDNLPPRLIASLGELFSHADARVQRAAVVIDVRGGEYFRELLDVLDELSAAGGIEPKVLFLTASVETLLNRFKETRRRHPLSPEASPLDGIQAEQKILLPLRERADWVLDTSDLTGAMLRRRIVTEMVGGVEAAPLAVTVMTFGFKNGSPRDADLMFDVRFLPNPHYREDLRPLTGRDPAVVEYAESGTLATEFYDRLFPLLDFLLPAYIEEGKSHLNIAIGCTGGRHRSVAVADRLAAHLRENHDEVAVTVVHRDCDLEG